MWRIRKVNKSCLKNSTGANYATGTRFMIYLDKNYSAGES